MANKPVELVLANALHDVLADIEKLPPPLRYAAGASGHGRPTVVDGITRRMLCQIAHETSIDVVLRAMAASGGPGSLAEVEARIGAAEDQRRGVTARAAGSAQAESLAPTKEGGRSA